MITVARPCGVDRRVDITGTDRELDSLLDLLTELAVGGDHAAGRLPSGPATASAHNTSRARFTG